MAKNYFSCVVSGNKPYLKDPQGKLAFLKLCKDAKAFFLEDGQPQGALSQVGVGDIIFLSFRQYIVAYGEVTEVQSINKHGFSHAIIVKDWVRTYEDYKEGVLIRGDVTNFSEPGTARGDKIKKLLDANGVWLMNQLNH